MSWPSSPRDRWTQQEDDEYPPRGRSRSSSRDRRHRYRRHSRSRSRDRWHGADRDSPRRSYRRRDSRSSRSRDGSRSRSHDRGWRRHSRSLSPRHRRSPSSPPPHHLPPWHLGPGAQGPPLHHDPHLVGPGPHPGPAPWMHTGEVLHGAPPTAGADFDQHQPQWDRSRGSDTADRDWDERGQGFGPPGPGIPEVPSASVFIKGLPLDADESDVCAAFSGFPNMLSVKVLRDRATGRGKGSAFLDFASVDDARALMESEARYSMDVGGQLLFLDYSSSGPTAGGAGQATPQDWICDMCNSVNFARRLECYHCSTARPANPRRVTADLNEPSHILKVSGLDPHTSEEALYQALAAVGPSIVDLRVIKDKFTGAPRGFAFVELPSVAAAGTVMMACQGMQLHGQSLPLKICYAKAKDTLLNTAAGGEGGSQAAWAAGDAAGGEGGSQAAWAAGDAAGAAAAAAAGGANAGAAADVPPSASGAVGWRPKEWKPKEFHPDGPSTSKQQQPAAGPGQAAAAGSGQPGDSATSSSGVDTAGAAAAAGPGSETAAGSAAAAAAAGVDAATIQAMAQAGFEYQASSGYWWDPKSGYFYDTASQLYYHHSTGQWYQYNADTGQYTVVGGAEQQQHQHHQDPNAAQQPAYHQAPGAAAAAGPPQQQQQQQKQASTVDKRRRAVIGSAPQYNPAGVLAAAALAEERAAEQQRIAAARAARQRQQEQQNKTSAKQQPKLMPGKPGIGMLPGTGNTPVAAAAAAPPAHQVVADGSVQGVVYRSKWSQQRAAQQSK